MRFELIGSLQSENEDNAHRNARSNQMIVTLKAHNADLRERFALMENESLERANRLVTAQAENVQLTTQLNEMGSLADTNAKLHEETKSRCEIAVEIGKSLEAQSVHGRREQCFVGEESILTGGEDNALLEKSQFLEICVTRLEREKADLNARLATMENKHAEIQSYLLDQSKAYDQRVQALSGQVTTLAKETADLENRLAAEQRTTETLRTERHKAFVRTSLDLPILRTNIGSLVSQKAILTEELKKQKEYAHQQEKRSLTLHMEKAKLKWELDIAQALDVQYFRVIPPSPVAQLASEDSTRATNINTSPPSSFQSNQYHEGVRTGQPDGNTPRNLPRVNLLDVLMSKLAEQPLLLNKQAQTIVGGTSNTTYTTSLSQLNTGPHCNKLPQFGFITRSSVVKAKSSAETKQPLVPIDPTQTEIDGESHTSTAPPASPQLEQNVNDAPPTAIADHMQIDHVHLRDRVPKRRHSDENHNETETPDLKRMRCDANGENYEIQEQTPEWKQMKQNWMGMMGIKDGFDDLLRDLSAWGTGARDSAPAE
ncbi:hypothetical protein BJ742DRAFT_901202 [Cladochytrium replicatum]|nr:hypothetical protein BJ742DRAFT_901202 [Cladochytrium replicatum]